MNFQFASLSDFWFMAGHGPYVWVCYLLMAVVLGWLVIAPGRARRQLLNNLARQQRLAEREAAEQP